MLKLQCWYELNALFNILCIKAFLFKPQETPVLLWGWHYLFYYSRKLFFISTRLSPCHSCLPNFQSHADSSSNHSWKLRHKVQSKVKNRARSSLCSITEVVPVETIVRKVLLRARFLGWRMKMVNPLSPWVYSWFLNLYSIWCV